MILSLEGHLELQKEAKMVVHEDQERIVNEIALIKKRMREV